VATLPLNLSKTLQALREASAQAGQHASLLLAGDAALVERAKREFSAGESVPDVQVGLPSTLSDTARLPGEVVVVLVAPEREAQAIAALGDKVPKKAVILAVDEGDGATGAVRFLKDGAVRLSFSDSATGWNRLIDLCAEAEGIALGRRYPVVRRAAAQQIISRTAGQNAFIALVFFIPGADMPAMTLNQAKMVLSIAAMYGERIDLERAVELLGVVALGVGFRGVARGLARWVPGLAILMRILTAYTATMAVGLAAISYYEKGAPASTSRVMALAGPLRR
jgi:uncharacterized protein (DUF697 family)